MEKPRFRRETHLPDGSTQVFQHNLPDALTHLYPPRHVDEEIPLYRGSFDLVDEDGSSQRYEGEVRLCWRPTPQLYAVGIAAVTAADFNAMFAASDAIWTTPPRLHLVVPSGSAAPQPPDNLLDPQFHPPGTRKISTHFQPYEYGDPSDLDRITVLLANGWAAHDTTGVADPDDLGTFWNGRSTAEGGGWHVIIDQTRTSTRLLKELRQQGGYGITHILELRRGSGARFRADEATLVIDAIRDAVGLFLGRRSAPLLPVGWRGTTPAWIAWRPPVVDPHHERGSWRDDTIASSQLAGVLAGFLMSWEDPLRRDTLHYTTGYYLQALDANIEVAHLSRSRDCCSWPRAGLSKNSGATAR